MSMDAVGRVLSWTMLGLVLLFLALPFLMIVPISFSASSVIAFPPQGFSLRWYEKALGSPAYLNAFWLSLGLAALVTLSATALGGAAAIGLSRGRAGSPAETFFLSPLVLPSIIFAIGLLMLWSALFGPTTFYTLWLAHTVLALPYVIRTTLAVLAERDPFLEEAARTMGATRMKRLWLVTLPQCRPGLFAGAFFAFNISFDEAVLSLFLRNPNLTTLPVQIYGQLEFSPDPTVAAVSTVMILVTIALMVVLERMLGLNRFAST
jgi:putative spermidine/putrescine transport system permease protein